MMSAGEAVAQQLDACIVCCVDRDGEVPLCTECPNGGQMVEGGKVNWELYGEFLGWARANGGRHASEYPRSLNNSLRLAGFFSREPRDGERGYYLLTNGSLTFNPHDGDGFLYFVEEEDAVTYANLMGYQGYHIFVHDQTV